MSNDHRIERPETWVFVDERIEHRDTSYRLVVGCLVVAASRWKGSSRMARQIGAIRGSRRLDLIAELLEQAGGFALLSFADLSTDLFTAQETDSTDDIPRMARRDNAWSQAVLAAVAAVLACLQSAGVNHASIDVYLDPKSLTAAHREAFERILRETLPDIAREAARVGIPSPTFTIGKVREVEKRRGKNAATTLQFGSALVHHLCSRTSDVIAGSPPRIIVRDHTSALVTMISKFTRR